MSINFSPSEASGGLLRHVRSYFSHPHVVVFSKRRSFSSSLLKTRNVFWSMIFAFLRQLVAFSAAADRNKSTCVSALPHSNRKRSQHHTETTWPLEVAAPDEFDEESQFDTFTGISYILFLAKSRKFSSGKCRMCCYCCTYFPKMGK